MINQNRHLTIRLSKELYKSYESKAIKKGKKENRIVKISEVIREALEKCK
jgi:hypothetical protein